MEEPVSVEVTVKPEPIDHDDNKAKNDNNEESLQLSNEEIWIKPEHIEDETEDPVTEDPITEEAETNVKVESKESGEVEAAQSSNVTCNTSRPTQVQIETLLHFLEENPGIAKGHMRSAQARHQTKLKWDEVATLLNTLGGAVKDAKAWAKFWSDKKYALKKSVAQRNASATRSGGAGDLLPPFSELDERLLLVMGGCSSADGDQDLRLPLNVPLESQGPSTCQATEMKAELSGADSLPGRLQDMPNTVASPASTPSRKQRLKARQIKRRNVLQAERDRLLRIEEKRVEAEVKNAAGWEKLVRSLDNLANAISVSADKIAQALLKRP